MGYEELIIPAKDDNEFKEMLIANSWFEQHFEGFSTFLDFKISDVDKARKCLHQYVLEKDWKSAILCVHALSKYWNIENNS